MFEYIGKYIPIHDVEDKVTGNIKYVGDMTLPNMLYGKLILSQKAHAYIKEIDISLAEKIEGITKIFTCKNTQTKKYNSFKWIKELKVIEDEFLFNDTSRFVGDRLGVIVGESMAAVEKALTLINIQYEELPIIVDYQEAITSKTKIHGNSNVYEVKPFQCGDVNSSFLESDIIIKSELETPKIHHGAMENHGVLVDIDLNDNITVYTPCQIIYQVQMLCSDLTELPLNKIRVIKTTMGGSFGGKGQPILEPIAAFIAKQLQRPIKIIFNRKESISSTRTRHKTFGKVETAFSKDGEILGRKIDFTIDSGAYFTNAEAVAIAAAKKTFRLYKIKNQLNTSRCVYTNTAIGGAARGYGSPQIQAITETNLDIAAKKLNIDPVELRMKNLVDPFDKDPLNGPELGNTRIKDCLIRGRELFKWDERKKLKEKNGRFLKGIGVACGTHGNGYYGAYPDFIDLEIKVNDDGSILLKGAFHDQGCGTITTMSQIASETLKINISDIIIPEADTLISPYDTAGTQACRVTFTVGGGVKKICDKLNEKIKKYASEILEENLENLYLENKMIKSRVNDKKLSYSELVIEIRKKYSSVLKVNYTHEAVANPASNAVNFVEISLDKYTGRIEIKEVVAVYDIGQAINTTFVHGQIHGALQMAAGMAISEELIYDKKGNLLSDSFTKYNLLNSTMMPNIKIDLIEKGEELGAYGAKSIGEVSTIALSAAIANAVYDALGVEITQLPLTPERVMKLINSN